MAQHMAKGTYCSCRGPEFTSQVLWGQLTAFCSSGSRGPTTLSGLHLYLIMCPPFQHTIHLIKNTSFKNRKFAVTIHSLELKRRKAVPHIDTARDSSPPHLCQQHTVESASVLIRLSQGERPQQILNHQILLTLNQAEGLYISSHRESRVGREMG